MGALAWVSPATELAPVQRRDSSSARMGCTTLSSRAQIGRAICVGACKQQVLVERMGWWREEVGFHFWELIGSPNACCAVHKQIFPQNADSAVEEETSPAGRVLCVSWMCRGQGRGWS